MEKIREIINLFSELDKNKLADSTILFHLANTLGVNLLTANEDQVKREKNPAFFLSNQRQ